jgi:hypothetical protein
LEGEPPGLCTTPVVGVVGGGGGGGGGVWITVGVLETVGVDAGCVAVVVVFGRRGGAGRGLSAGVGGAF